MSDFVIPSSGHHTLSGLLIATPATLTVSALTIAPRALARRFVGAESEERRLTELPVGGPLRVDELRDEIRTHPRGVAHSRRRIKRRRVRVQRHELSRQLVERLFGEPGPDLADVAQVLLVVETDEQRAEMPPPTFRRGVSADDELGFLTHLHFSPER